MENKYIASFLLHALGDTIGYKNGEWEFNMKFKNENSFAISRELLYEFIELGGINDINLDGWKVSDDTAIHMIMTENILNSNSDIPDKIADSFAHLIIQNSSIDAINGRHPGYTTSLSIRKIQKGFNWREFEYNFEQGGNGAAMRTLVIGMAYHGKENRKKLIEIALETSRVTHNSSTGYLGGVTSALFASFAIEGVPLNKWAFKLINILESNLIDDYMKETRGLTEYQRDKDIFIDKWKKYVEDKFDDGKVVYNKAFRDVTYRSKYYHENFGYKETPIFPGSGGDDSLIIAYDCLLDSNASWEKLVIYSMIHVGDSDTTGAIAGGLYGLLYGIENIPHKNLLYLEHKEKLIDLGKKVYQKFYNKK